MKKQAFVFDVDGTVTESRCEIKDSHIPLWKHLCITSSVYIVTGSDRDKTNEQMKGLQDLALGVYQCGGNSYWQNGKLLHETPFILDIDMHQFLKDTLKGAEYPRKTGVHIEERRGMVNFSILGRNATAAERLQYKKYDQKELERDKISKTFNALFPRYESYVAGDTGIDIFMKDKHKGQVYKNLTPHYSITYFGDKFMPGGNDYPFVQNMKVDDTLHGVSSPDETFEIVEKYLESL